MPSSASPDEQLLSLTREMLGCAESGEWEQLVALEQTRLPLFGKVFAKGVTGKVELARQVLELDQATKRLAETEMPALQQKILKLKNSGQANHAYQAVQGIASGHK